MGLGGGGDPFLSFRLGFSGQKDRGRRSPMETVSVLLGVHLAVYIMYTRVYIQVYTYIIRLSECYDFSDNAVQASLGWCSISPRVPTLGNPVLGLLAVPPQNSFGLTCLGTLQIRCLSFLWSPCSLMPLTSFHGHHEATRWTLSRKSPPCPS